MTTAITFTPSIASSTDVAQTFVEQHTVAIAHLLAFVTAVQNYVPGMAGANAALQDAMRPLRVPTHINMTNALQWAQNAIQAEERALALEMQKDAAFATLKLAERNRRDAERLAQRARKAWTILTAVNSSVVPTSGSIFKIRASNANNHTLAA